MSTTKPSPTRLAPGSPELATIESPIVRLAYTLLKTRNRVLVESYSLGVHSLVDIAVALVPIMQELVTESHQGGYKRMLLIQVLHKIVNEDFPANQRAPATIVVDMVVAPMIDKMIDVAKGKINLKKSKLPTDACCTIF